MKTHPNKWKTMIMGLLLLVALKGNAASETETASCTSCPGDQAESALVTCEAHGVDVELCYVCDPSKREKGRLWCNGHNRYEDRCWDCQPQLEDKERLFCEEHALYEDECFYCDPTRAKATDAQPAAKAETSKAELITCDAHGVDVELCYLCDSSKREQGRLWCNGHNRYEDRCWDCQPQLEDKERPFCEEHALYEDECFYCDPVRSADLPTGTSTKPLWCSEHDVAEHECGICQPQMASDLSVGEAVKIRFPSADSSSAAGIVSTQPKEGITQATIEALFEVSYNQNRLALITPLADGVVKTVHADVGDRIKAGDVLVEIHSDDVAAAKAQFLTSLVKLRIAESTYKREKKLSEENISAARDYQEAQATRDVARLDHRMAQQRLLNFGMTQDEITEVEKNEDGSSVIKLRAPFVGTLVERSVVVGEAVKKGAALFKVADLSSMWIELSIAPEFADLVQAGQAVSMRIDGATTELNEAVITWVDTGIDKRNRMLKARAVVKNPSGFLRSGMFGHGTIQIAPGSASLLLPRDAIQYHEGRPYIFVKDSADLYELRHVRMGPAFNGDVAILEGVSASEQVVTEGGFIALSEFLKSRLGAGCVDD